EPQIRTAFGKPAARYAFRIMIASRDRQEPAGKPREVRMADYRIISADSHIVEPPDMYTARFDPKLRNRAPHMERRKTPAGREYDAWMLEGRQAGTLGAVMQAGQRFEDPSQIDFLGVWEDVRKGAYDAAAMLVENEEDGIWGSVLQPSRGLFLYGVPDCWLCR